MLLRLLEHPAQRDIRQPRLLVASSHIAMHARKPHLFHLIVVRKGRVVRIRPQRRKKRAAAFVNTHRVIPMLDAWMKTRIEESILLLVHAVEEDSGNSK